MTKSKIDLSISLLTYNTKDLAQKCLESIYANTSNISFEILLVDNASTDGTPQMIRKNFPKVKLLANRQNLLFIKAHNQNLKKVKGRYFLILNEDTEIGPGVLGKMVEFMEQKKDCQVQGPKMLENDKKLVYSCRKFPTWNAIIGNRIGGFKKSTDNYLMKKYNHKSPRVVDWVSGGCMMFRPLFRFDERFFLYMEDVDFCTGKKVWYNPNAVVLHAPQYGSQIKPLLFIYHIMSYIKYQLKLISRK